MSTSDKRFRFPTKLPAEGGQIYGPKQRRVEGVLLELADSLSCRLGMSRRRFAHHRLERAGNPRRDCAASPRAGKHFELQRPFSHGQEDLVGDVVRPRGQPGSRQRGRERGRPALELLLREERRFRELDPPRQIRRRLGEQAGCLHRAARQHECERGAGQQRDERGRLARRGNGAFLQGFSEPSA